MFNQLISSIESYTSSIKNYVQSRLGEVAVAEKRTIGANSSRVYQLATLIDNAENYDLLSASIVVKVLDPDDQSPTYGLFINSEAAITTGVNEVGQVVIHNYYDQALECYIRIDVPLRKP